MSVAVQLPPLTNDTHNMATPTSMHLSLTGAPAASSADAMNNDSDAFTKGSDLPPMPVPYEGKLRQALCRARTSLSSKRQS